MLLALPKGRVSISQKGKQSVLIIMNTIIDGSRFWLDNTLKAASTECQQFVVL